jgi:hypothetical protein
MTEPNVYFVLLSRRDDCSREQFLHAWTGEHRRLIDELPGLVEARLLPVADPADGGPDGVGLLFFRTAADLRAALASPASARLRAHTQTFARSEDALRLLLSDQARA